MKLENKAMLFKVDFSITSGRKVDKEVSSKIADDYNVSGGSQASGNFNKITKHKKWVLLEHQVTKERKWVDLNQIYSEGVPNAFYDADIHFCPEDVSKWS